MAKITEAKSVKLFCGVIHSRDFLPEKIRETLEVNFGLVDIISPPFEFTFTDYYEHELGKRPIRRFYSFEKLVKPDIIASVKVLTNKLEKDLSNLQSDFPRPVNLDPGYLEAAKIVLASAKNFYHRIYLSDGIWGEVTLYYKGGRWNTLPWTFPDFCTIDYHKFFMELRKRYMQQLKEYTQI